MRRFHGIIAAAFVIVALVIFTLSEGEKRTPTLISLLISNVSLLAISIENALRRRDKTN